MTKTLPNVTALQWHTQAQYRSVCKCLRERCKEEVLILMLLAMCLDSIDITKPVPVPKTYYTILQTEKTKCKMFHFPFSEFWTLLLVHAMLHTHSIPAKVFFSMISSMFISSRALAYIPPTPLHLCVCVCNNIQCCRLFYSLLYFGLRSNDNLNLKSQNFSPSFCNFSVYECCFVICLCLPRWFCRAFTITFVRK